MMQQLIIFCIFFYLRLFSYNFTLGLFYYQRKIMSLYFGSALYIYFSIYFTENFFIVLLSTITTSLSLFHTLLYLYLLRTFLPSLFSN